MDGMRQPVPTPQPVTRGALFVLGALAVLLAGAGLLPWLAGGSAAARGFATPLLLVGLFAGYAVLRAARTPATPPQRAAGCAGCQCAARCQREAQ